MKKYITLLLIVITCLFSLTACNENSNRPKKNVEETDAAKFKEEYEKLNGTTRENDGKTIRTIEVAKDNPFKYKTADEIVEAINNKETFAVYFGFSTCPWCRSVVPSLIEVANDLKINDIYYVDVKEIRDVLELDKDEKVVIKQKGSDGYYKLLDAFDDVLEDYNLIGEDGKSVSTGEKRIFAPNIVAVIDGKVTKLTTGTSSKQTDAYMELTDEMKEDMYDNINDVLKLVINNKNSCNYNSAC